MDGRKCIIYLPNDGKLELTVHGKQSGKDLWKIVERKLHLREEDYFGLKYKTSGEHYSWLQPDRRVLDHDIEMKSTVYPLEFLFSVRFFEDSVTVHKHPSTVEFIFLHVQNLIYNGEICVPSDLSLELAALSLQAFYGDFVSEEIAFANFKKLSCLPRSVIQELSSLEYCEEQVISWYKNLCGFSRGQAVLLYMSKVEKLSTYGIHYFKVKDFEFLSSLIQGKQTISESCVLQFQLADAVFAATIHRADNHAAPTTNMTFDVFHDKARSHWWLGICNKGIYQYRADDKVSPHHIFQWRNLENLYFREKKFSVEVCSGHKRALSIGSTNVVTEKPKKAKNNQLTPKTHTWYGSPALIKSIWTMAIGQHQFYWDRKQSLKSKSRANNTNASNLRNALDENSNSHIISPSNDSTMQRKNNRKKAEITPKVKTVAPTPPSSPKSPEVKALEAGMISDLKKRKLALEDSLYDKVQELKEICKEEYNLSEKLPIEYFRYMLPTEDRPVLRKKIGAEYRVHLRPHPNRAHKLDLGSETELQKLESECELLTQITRAASKLAYDPSSKGRMKRKRLQSYQKSLKKLQDLENRINELREKRGQEAAFRQSTLIMTSDFDIINVATKECSIDEKSDRESLSSGNMLDDQTSISSGTEVYSTHSTPALSQRPYSGSADVDVDELPLQRSRTPPPTKSTKVAWLESQRVQNKKKGHGSYRVLPSPTSYHSTPSHSSGTETPPHPGQREWGLKWAQPRHSGWKMSSLDSLDSIGSRKSNEHAHSSPTKHQDGNGDIPELPNANARRIAKAAKSAQAHKVSIREKHVHSEPSRRMRTVNPVLEIVQDTVPDDGKDSRTSLTDSGVGTDSRVQSCQEEEVARKKKTPHAIRRDISDSSLSELSTHSNPVVLPSSGHIPKFVPSFMTRRNRAVTQLEQTLLSEESAKESEHPHLRKRSSSYTESPNSTLTHPTSKKDPHRTLTHSKTLNENENRNPDLMDSSRQNGSIPSRQDVANAYSPGLVASQSANQLPPPVFDTNLNICRQYLSRSQGQLVQNNSSATQPPESKNATSGRPYISVVDKPVNATNSAGVQRQTYTVSVNNSNNKMNFGQIYKLSQAPVTQNYTRLYYKPSERSQMPQEATPSHNVPKCNSLDSVLDRGHQTEPNVNPDEMRNYAVEHQYPVQNHSSTDQYPPFHPPTKSTAQRSGTPTAIPSSQQDMTLSDRDKYNNEAFQEIRGMAWVPSLDEYGSRASVAESLPAKSKREDIRELLQQHFAVGPKRSPSSSSTTVMRTKREKQLQARIRTEMMKEKESRNNPESSLKSDSSVNTWEIYKQNLTLKKKQNQGAYKPTSRSEHPGVNIFAHKPPPPLPQQMQRPFMKSSDTASGYSQGTIHKGYVNPNEYVMSMPVADRRPTYPILYNSNPDYDTLRSHKSTHPAYCTTAPIPFERGYLSATLPRKYTSRESSPQQASPVSDGPLRSSPQANFTRTYSSPTSKSIQDPNLYRPSNYARHRHQHSADSLLAHSFTSPPRSFPAAEERQSSPSNHVTSHTNQQAGKDMQSLQQGQAANYYYQVNLQAQQSKMPERDRKKQSKKDESPRTISKSENGALVIQATRTSPDGHKVSVFTITKGAPSTSLPSNRQEKDDEDDYRFFDADKTITSEAENTPVASPSPLTQSTGEESSTDKMQALAIEAARRAQKPLNSSRRNLDKYSILSKIPPPLPATPPSSNLHSSTRGRLSVKDFGTTVKRTGESGTTRLENSAPAPRKIPVPVTKTPRLRSKTRKDRESSLGRSSSPSTPSVVNNGVTIPVKDLRSGAKTPNRAQRSPSPNPVIPTFHRMLSTPIRTKPVALQQNGSPQNNKSTGMYKEPMSGVSARSRPPAAPRIAPSTPTPTRSALKATPAESRQLDNPRPAYQIGQSGTLPRTPRTHNRIERSGSTSGSAYQAGRLERSISTTPYNDSRSQQGRSYMPTPRKEFYSMPLGSDEQLKYKRKSLPDISKSLSLSRSATPEMVVGAAKPPLPIYQTATRCKTASVNLKRKQMHRRSSSETWKQQNLVTVNIPQQHYHAVLDPQQHHHQLYPHMGHHGMDPRTPLEHPRRTASADDLLRPTPDGRDPKANLNIRAQQGTLV